MARLKKEACKNYNRYNGIYKPKCGCQPCYDKWININRDR